jgi:hypothetical protein
VSWFEFFQRRYGVLGTASKYGKTGTAAVRAESSSRPLSSVALDPRTDELFDDAFQRRLETLALSSRRIFSGRERADRSAKRQGQGVAFADHREYSAGDDFRFVDWGAYQRLGRLLVRVYEEQEDLAVYFLIDCSRSMSFGSGEKFTQARRICAALSYVSLTNLDRVSIVGLRSAQQSLSGTAALDAKATSTSAPRLAPARGKSQIFKILRFLTRLEASGATDLGRNLESFVAQNRRRGLAVLVSDLYDPNGYQRGIDLLRYNKFEPVSTRRCQPGTSCCQTAKRAKCVKLPLPISCPKRLVPRSTHIALKCDNTAERIKSDTVR